MTPYGSHMPILTKYFDDFKPKTAWEFGCGDSSTPLFIEHCESVVAIEMQKPDWFIRITDVYGGNKNLNLYCMLGPFAAPEYLSLQQKRFDLVFADGHMGSRWMQINSALSKTNVIITHDTDQPCYHWERVSLPSGWVWIDIVNHVPWTAIITKSADVIQWAEQFETRTFSDTQLKTYERKQ